MNNLLNRLALTKQIALIGVIGVFGLVAIGAVYLVGNAQQDAARKRLERATLSLETLTGAQIDLLDTRRAEKDFLLRRREEYVTKHEKERANALSALVKLRTMLPAAQQATLDKAVTEVNRYVEQFNAVVKNVRTVGLDENSGLQGTLRKAVHEIETSIANESDAHFMASMLMMRRHEKDFLARKDAKYVASFTKTAGEFQQLIASAKMPDDRKAAIGERLANYQRDFVEASKGVLSEGDAIASLSKIYAEAEPLLESMNTQVREFAGAAQRESEASMARTSSIIMVAIASIAVVVAALAFLVIRGIVATLDGISGRMDRLAKGDLDIEITGTERHDAIGTLSRSLEVFRDNARTARRLEHEQKEEQQRKEFRAAAIDGFIQTFERSVQGLLDALMRAAADLHVTSSGMSATAEETSRQAAAVSHASEEASMNVQTVAASAEELTATVNEITRQVSQSATVAQKAVDEAGRTNHTVQGLAEAAQKIGEVVTLIQNIAAQTNLLALNATIEAARAGEAGKGFAVVASEVKALATQTGKATEDISGQISTIQHATEEAVQAIRSIGGTIGEVSSITTAIAAAVEEQAAATQEISRSTVEAAHGTEAVSANIAGVNQAANDTGVAAAQVKSASEALSAQGETLKSEVYRFLEQIRAA
ncbi:methyl-accepting chemotaxis protein [Roseiterribacter gracilis]|uniref:Methyl-accepting chemotaxis protein n=1 Tax=Roseiterribacter gracilis TaxID=2812848 RepID=A0A8S8XHA2_9PROT|nr:methyl-accepting chemotaxis protein [Rhodospirillales bacterium TMPK1]